MLDPVNLWVIKDHLTRENTIQWLHLNTKWPLFILVRTTGFILSSYKGHHTEPHSDRKKYDRMVQLSSENLNEPRHTSKAYQFGDNVKQAWPPLPLVHVALPDEVFLCMASYLRRCPSLHKVSWNTPPVPLPKFLQSKQKQTMFLFCPWYTCFQKTSYVRILP